MNISLAPVKSHKRGGILLSVLKSVSDVISASRRKSWKSTVTVH